MGRRFRQLLVSFLALWYGRSQKEIAAGAALPPKRVSQYLTRDEIKDDIFERLLAALRGRPAAVSIVTWCLEALEVLHRETDLTEEEQVAVEEGALRASRVARQALTAAVLRSRAHPGEDYPEASSLAPARRRAAELVASLRKLTVQERLAVVRLEPEYQSWAVCEQACEESVRQASRNIESAAAWARLAREIADRVPGPEGWRYRIRGYACGPGANILRVSGELKASEAAFEEAKRLWQEGADSLGVLDPGRLLDLEASLRKDQRRTDEALALLEEAASVGHCPERALILKGITLEKMGEYERAVATLLRATALVERHADPRQWNILHFNLSVNYCHIGRYNDAVELLPQMRELAAELGDGIDLWRMTWLEGRAAAGLGRPWEARQLLREARRNFAAHRMSYDVALALLEEAALLLDQGRTAEAKVLAQELTEVFESKGVHREALVALRLFQEAVERETATAELARRVLRFLFRARHDQDLRFTL
jgi:tetratricopeptide (TPR) repeat protein